MDLYTSTSKENGKQFLLILLLCKLVSILFVFIYFKYFNAELVFWRKAIKTKIAYTKSLNSDKPKIFFIGGSSCSFSVIPSIVSKNLDYDVVNLGLHAGSGRNIQLEFALELLKEGDVLVLDFETNFWTKERPFYRIGLGSQLAYSFPDLFLENQTHNELKVKDGWSIFDLRPGGKHVVSMLGKAAYGLDNYRYALKDIKREGYIVYDGNIKASPVSVAPLQPKELPVPIIDFLKKLSEYCNQKNIKLFVSFPWQFTIKSKAEEKRNHNISVANLIEPYAHVLSDFNWGVSVISEIYSDTEWHLNEKGAQIRSKTLCNALKSSL